MNSREQLIHQVGVTSSGSDHKFFGSLKVDLLSTHLNRCCDLVQIQTHHAVGMNELGQKFGRTESRTQCVGLDGLLINCVEDHRDNGDRFFFLPAVFLDKK